MKKLIIALFISFLLFFMTYSEQRIISNKFEDIPYKLSYSALNAIKIYDVLKTSSKKQRFK
ncbi:hypothetical protein HXK64_00890 [Candidatus Gracilibacteria bacterium]|nr:hypothetical protein [Candidatus Gracilibacteria bacterium]